MTPNDNAAGPPGSSRRSARLRMIGSIMLALGIGGAGMVYWLGTRSPDLSDDLSMLGYNKAEQRQMGRLYGKMGTLVNDWLDDLKRPGTQATLILLVSGSLAAGCFYFAPWLDQDEKKD